MNGKKIRELREAMDLSQQQFAVELDVSVQTVYRWEAGKSKPLPSLNKRLLEMARSIGVRI